MINYKFRLITEDGNIISAPELLCLADQAVNDIPARCLVFLECSNTVEGIAAYVGLLRRRAVLMLLGKQEAGESALRTRVSSYMPEYMFLRKKSANISCLGFDHIDGEKIIYEKMSVLSSYDLWKRTTVAEPSIPHPDLALLLPTSGTTGSRKYVRISYRNLISNTEAIKTYLGMDEKETGITNMSMSYAYGLSIVNTTLFCGGTLLLTEKGISDRRFWDFFRKQQGTSFAGVPYAYEFLERMGFLQHTIPSLRTLTQAGGKLSTHLQGKFAHYAEQRDIHFYIMYGQTEATARMTYLPSEKVLLKPGSVGVPVPGGSIQISPVDGEICYHGPNVSMGYAECRTDLETGDENKGALYTGDLGRLDEDGYLYITGRKKRIAKICGRRINLMELDERLSEHFEGEFFCREEGDRLVIFGTGSCGEENVLNVTSSETGLQHRLLEYHRLEHLERNENGKPM